MNSDEFIAPCNDLGQDEICPEMNAVRSSDDGFSCGGSDDYLLDLLGKMGY